MVCYNERTEVRCVVHGDDFTFMGGKKELMEVRGCMQEWWDIKVRGILGDAAEDDKEATIFLTPSLPPREARSATATVLKRLLRLNDGGQPQQSW